MRLQETIRLIFDHRFRKLGSARQITLSLATQEVHFPRPSDGKKMVSFDWTPIRYLNVISALKNPFYSGVYVYGKTEKRTTLVDGRLRKTKLRSGEHGYRTPEEALARDAQHGE